VPFLKHFESISSPDFRSSSPSVDLNLSVYLAWRYSSPGYLAILRNWKCERRSTTLARLARNSRGRVIFLDVMKIYLGFTVAGDRSSIQIARRMVTICESAGHIVLTRHLVEDNAWQADRLISPQEVFRRDMRWLNECDIFIAEVSGSSFGLGFEAGYLLGSSNKRVILFYKLELAPRISLLITGNSHPNCTLVPYADLAQVENFVSAEMRK
jgi:2'-deoxynucleoside 5'-phosphate N-hydrolase